MKKPLKYSLLIFISLFGLLLMLPLAIYIPAVQRWGKTEIINYVQQSTGMTLHLEELSIGFPLKLKISNILLLTVQQDTLLQSRQIEANVSPAKLLLGQVDVSKIILNDTYLNFANNDSTLQLSASVNHLSTHSANIVLRNNLIDLPDTRLSGADISLTLLESPTDTLPPASTPLKWKINIGDFRLDNVQYAMQMRPIIEQLKVSIHQASLQEGEVNLFAQSVQLNNATIEQSSYQYFIGSGNSLKDEKSATDTLSTQPWSVQIQHIELLHNEALYALPNYTPQKGLDLSYLSFNHINLTIDSLYNRGKEIRVPLKQLSFVERSGLTVTHSEGAFFMDSTRIALDQFGLQTPYSRIDAQVQIGNGLFTQSPQTPIEANLQAQIAIADLLSLFPDYRSYVHGIPLSTPLISEISIIGQLADLQLQKGEIQLPETLSAQLTGRVKNLPDTQRVQGSAIWDCRLSHSPLITHLLNDTSHRVHLPDTYISGTARLKKDTVTTQSLIKADKGNIDLNVKLNLSQQHYQGNLEINRFPLAAYLPHDSLGILSASMNFSGRGYNPIDSKTQANINLSIDSLDYMNYRYKNLWVDTRLQQGELNGTISATDPNLKAALSITGELSPHQYTGNINGNLYADLMALQLSNNSCTLSTDMTLSGSAIPLEDNYNIDLAFSNFSTILSAVKLKTNRLTLSVQTDSTQTKARLQNGDLAVNFDSELGINTFLEKIDQSLPILATVQQERRLDMVALHQALPTFQFSTTAKQNNLLFQYLKGMNISFARLNLKLQNDSVLNTIGKIDRFSTAGITLDTIQMTAYEPYDEKEKLYYSLRIGNKAGNLDQLASLALNGFLSGNRTQLFCLQKNQRGETGFRIGCEANFLDSLLQVSFFPQNPTIGFETWTLNENNFFTYYYNRHFDADISLIHGDKHLIIATQHDNAQHDLSHQEALSVDIKGIEIAPWLSLSPFAPQISGSILADLQVHFPTRGVQVNGNLGINNFQYGKQRAGDFNLNIDYQLDSLNRHIAQTSLAINSTQVMTLTGKLDNQAQNPIDLNLDFIRFPLTTINPFLPLGLAQLQGAMNSRITLSGTMKSPQLNGFIQMENVVATSPSMGASLKLPQDTLRIHQNILQVNNYAISGASKNPLYIHGGIDFNQLNRITTDLTLKATEFQPVKSQKNTKATLYGSAITDINLTAKGALDALKIRGNINLLTGTEITYVMQDSPFALQQQKNNLVTFVSFNDSVDIVEPDTIPTQTLSGMDILVNINISPTVKMGVNLSVDGKNRIDLQGGGELTYTMSPLGDSRFTGRYNLNSGFVRYNPPIISEKLFVIQEGSYVTWNGEIANPNLSITAIETMRTLISENDKNTRQVNFEISILIKNTLENLSIVFDLAAPEDLTLQNQLSSLTAEQRASQAMSLLIYNTYTGPGTSTKADLLGNPLNAFLERELNQWAQENLKGVDLSFGINSYTDASGINTRTDYSYRASKSLWNNRVKVVVGGSLSPDDNANVNFKENFIDDISLEYYLNQRDNMYIKVFRHTGYESILEGEVTQTGVGFVFKKRLLNLGELFRFRKTQKEMIP